MKNFINSVEKYQSHLSSQNNNLNDQEEEEELLKSDNRRYSIFPIKYQKVWDAYKTQEDNFWKAEEIDFSRDYDDYLKLNKDEQHFVKMILAFFANADGIVNFNLGERFIREIEIMEVQVALRYQMMMEDIHGETYSLMLDSLVKDKKEKAYLLNSIETVPSIKRMADWAFKWIDSSKKFAYRVVAFAIVEGVFFSGAFAAIYWFKKKHKGMLNGLVKSNEFIARDEGQHTQFSCTMYSMLKNKLSQEEVYQIMDEGVIISQKFVDDAIPVRLIGMNAQMMNDYIEFIADRLLISLGYTKKYNKKNPFKFMETIGMLNKTNFFENRPTDYQDANVKNKSKRGLLNITDDF
ncbi:MAG: ribonucleoside-diphosphate reductase [Magnetococcales bacterium]|nr:ribonucleoside-diphosphate reductase [Magnetococcales bacterium]